MKSLHVFLVVLIALCAASIVNAGAFCYFEQIPGGIAKEPICDGPNPITSKMNFRLYNLETKKYLAYTKHGAAVKVLVLDKKNSFNWKVLPGKDSNSALLKTSTGNKYLASPKKKPNGCVPALLSSKASDGILDLQCNNPDDMARDLSKAGDSGPPDGWAGECGWSSFNNADLNMYNNSKAAQWCGGTNTDNPKNFDWHFIKV